MSEKIKEVMLSLRVQRIPAIGDCYHTQCEITVGVEPVSRFVGSAKDLMTPDGKRELIPTDMMVSTASIFNLPTLAFLNLSLLQLHQQDTTMISKDPNNPNSLYSLDLPTGKVVEEWKIDDSTEVTSFVPRTKFAQMNPEATFIGTSHNSLYTVDPRVSGNKRVNNQTRSYKTRVDFACAVTTESGEVAIGSHNGDIRLYDAVIGRNAKTALQKLKDPVLGIEGLCALPNQPVI
ncbi:VID27 cytoplasmic protein-domain-containing protein [Melampsora americana]|nr:VID27 cytoplasmic protein-domain-containing protein [Melampsora americana]